MNFTLWLTFVIYFVTHIPITMFVDCQVLFGPFYPKVLKDLLKWYIDTYNDQLVASKPTWFVAVVWAEALFQLPFFFVATYGLLMKRNWIRIPSILYGSHVATTVWAIIPEMLLHPDITGSQKQMLFGFYFPYFLIPLILALYMAFHPVPFPETAAAERTATVQRHSGSQKKRI